jgi:uncharacterized protein YjbI with pentapeptide repeats
MLLLKVRARTLSALFGAAITLCGLVAGGLVTAGGAARAAEQATVTCPTVSPSGVVTPAPTPGVDWAGCTLYEANLSGADLSGANLTDALLVAANMSGTTLTGATLTGVRSGRVTGTPAALPANWHLLNGFLLGPGAFVYNARLVNADLSGFDLTGATIDHSALDGANLSGADLTGATAEYVRLIGTDISGANLTGATLIGVKSGGITASSAVTLPPDWTLLGGYLMGPIADLSKANLTGLDLTGVDLRSADLTDATITGAALAHANLTSVVTGGLTGIPASEATPNTIIKGGYLIGPDAYLWAASLSGLNLAGADLSGAYLVLANLSGADLSGADVSGADFQETTLTSADLDGTDLSTVDLAGVWSGGITSTPAALPPNWELVSGYLIGPQANLDQASLAGADLIGADLSSTGWYQADLTDADLASANLTSADFEDANLTNASLAGATITGATFPGATWSNTTCPDGSNSDKHVAGCFSPLDTTPPTVAVTGVSNGKVYVVGAVPAAHCTTTDNGTVATPATLKVTTTGRNGVGRFTATCSGAVDLAGNKQQAPVSVTYTVVYGLHGFIAPANGATIARSSKTITVRFRLTSANGAAISASLAKALAAAHDVRVTLQGPGIKAVTVYCGWNASQQDLTCAIRIPSGVRTGTAQRYTLTAAENVGTGFLTVPVVKGGANPEVIHFR